MDGRTDGRHTIMHPEFHFGHIKMYNDFSKTSSVQFFILPDIITINFFILIYRYAVYIYYLKM